MPQYPQRADNTILTGGLPLVLSLEAYSAIDVGDVVEFAAGCLIRPGTVNSTETIGIADISVQSRTLRGGGRTLPYAAGDLVRVLRGSITCMLRLAVNENISCGEMLKPAASGEVQAYVCGVDNDCQRVAQSLETLAVNTLTFQWIHVMLERHG